MQTRELADLLIDTIVDKKGSDIILLDLREQAVFADYFLICNGDNERQLRTLAENIAQDAKTKAHVRPLGLEGEPEGGWLLLDFGDLIVHMFSPRMRAYYRLEELWDKAHIVMRMH